MLNLYRGLRELIIALRAVHTCLDKHTDAYYMHIDCVSDAIEADYGRFGRVCTRICFRIFG
jgi:hypothetical protein